MAVQLFGKLDEYEVERLKKEWAKPQVFVGGPLASVSNVRSETELRAQLAKYQRQAKVYAEQFDSMESVACSLVASVLAYALSQTSEPCALFKVGDW